MWNFGSNVDSAKNNDLYPCHMKILNYSILLGSLMLSILTTSYSKELPYDLSAVKIHPVHALPWYGEMDASEQINETAFIDSYLELFGELSDVRFEEIKRQTDQLGFTHISFQQFFGEIEVSHGILKLHVKDGYVESFNGEIYRVHSPIPVAYSFDEAKELFLVQFPERIWDVFLNDEHETDLVWALDEFGVMQLCYKFRIQSSDASRDDYLFFNPNQKAVVRLEPQLIHSDSVGTAKTYYRGNQKIIADFVSTDKFRLRENARPISTYDRSLGVDLIDSNNVWETTGKEIAGDVHWGMEKVHEFMDKKFKWDSYANNGDTMTSVLNFAGSGNAFWNLAGNYATFLVNKTSTLGPCAALDVVGHEFGHGIADENAGLVYAGESCMLHESFADISGSVTEFFADSAKANWLIGDEVWAGSGGIRNMQDPSKFNHPKTYKGKNWGGGCHGNGGVQNYWFYMMVAGDSGTNDNSFKYNIKGLGRDKATQIIYRAIFYYATPNTTFPEMAAHTLKACKDLYGSCGAELQMTWDAWKAVGIIDTTVQLINLSHGILAPKLRCTSLPIQQKFDSKGDPTRTTNWYLASSSRDSLSINLDFNNYGTTTILLRTEVCKKVFYDTLLFQVNAQPKADFSASKEAFCLNSGETLICTNLTKNTDPTQNLLYSWKIDPYQIVEKTTDLKFPLGNNPYNFDVELTSYYATGCSSKSKKSFSMYPSPVAKFTAKSMCQGEKLLLNNLTDTSRQMSFEWTFNSDLPQIQTSQQFIPNLKFDQAQNIFISLEATDVETECKSLDTMSVSVYNNPIPSFRVERACLQDTVHFIHTSSNKTPLTWFQWNFGVYKPFNRDTLQVIARSIDPLVMSLELRDQNGCKGIVHDTIKIEEIKVDFEAKDFCLNEQAVLANTSQGKDLTFSWDFGNGKTSNDTTGSVSYDTAGVYPVVLSAQNDRCKANKAYAISILKSPLLNYEIDGICQGDSTYFINNTEEFDVATDYVWSFGDGDSSVERSPAHLYNINQTTSYNAKVKATNSNGCVVQDVKVLMINELPDCGFSWDYTWPNREVVFTPAIGSYQSYNWNFGDGSKSTDKTPLHSYADDKTYTVHLEAQDQNGCICSSTLEVQGSNVGIQSINGRSPVMYPNPNKGSFSIRNVQAGAYDLEIFDVNGRLVFSNHISHNESIQPLGNLALINNVIEIQTTIVPGMYTLEMKHGNERFRIPFAVF
jgi:Zn-dependent metalloprotease/PKD repeat protein